MTAASESLLTPAENKCSPELDYENGQLSFGEDEDKFQITAYTKSPLRRCCCILLYILSGGTFFLFLHWLPRFWPYFNLKKSSFHCAQTVVVREISTGECSIEQVVRMPSNFIKKHFIYPFEQGHITEVLSLMYKRQKYFIINNELVLVSGLENIATIHILQSTHGLSDVDYIEKSQIYGVNEIAVEVPRIHEILFREILNPFYMFQICSVIIWMFDEYEAYALSIIVITTFSMVTTLHQVRKERTKLREMVEQNYSSKVHCLRNNEWMDIWSRELVPGDIINIPYGGCNLPADCCLLTGECIVDEGMLTGECVPVMKSPLKASDSLYHPESSAFKSFTLYGGTTVLQTRCTGSTKCTGKVIRTGYQSARGRLVRSILYPKTLDLKLTNDAVHFVMIMGLIAILGFSYSIVMQYYACVKTSDIIIQSLDVLTIVVPPALPAALAVGITYAQKRLKKKNIFTVSPKRINLSGAVNIVLFDKTGTLTEDGLEFFGTVDQAKFLANAPIELSTESKDLTHALAACHSLTKINGELNGDPLELEMLSSTGWKLKEPNDEEEDLTDNLKLTYVYDPSGNDNVTIHHMRQFPFSSEEARQTVLVKKIDPNGDNKLVALIKGAPERIAKMIENKSIPENYFETLNNLTRQGHRVIALAQAFPKCKILKALKAPRETLEENASFLGFLILQNKLKTETRPVLEELKGAGIKCVMVTGDNILTAICVGKEAGMIETHEKILIASVDRFSKPYRLTWRQNNTSDEIATLNKSDFGSDDFCIAMTGTTFSWIIENEPYLLPYILVKGTIFARMNPQNKATVVDQYEKMDFVCCFCGDGANDCSALKRASVGISLSELEASVASPFTSKLPNINCVAQLIKEGRCALMTTFGMFKYMALYSMIQFCTILILYWRTSNLSDYEYLYIDLIIINLVALTMSLNGPSEAISRKTPPKALVSGPTIFSLFIHLFICVGFQVFIYFYTAKQTWFCSITDNSPPCLDTAGIKIKFPNNISVVAVADRFDKTRCEEMESEREVLVSSHITAAMFYFSAFQYIIMACVFSVGEPFRQPVTKNIPFLLSLITLTGVTAFIVLSDNKLVAELFEVAHITAMNETLQIPTVQESLFRFSIIICAIINCAVCNIVERYIVENRAFWTFWKRYQPRRHKNKKYVMVENFVNENEYWPPRVPESVSLKMATGF